MNASIEGWAGSGGECVLYCAVLSRRIYPDRGARPAFWVCGASVCDAPVAVRDASVAVRARFNHDQNRCGDCRLKESPGENVMTRRGFFSAWRVPCRRFDVAGARPPMPNAPKIEPLELPDAEWKKRLSPAAIRCLCAARARRPFTAHLTTKGQGTLPVRRCDLPLFGSEMKFDSGTGWPSFFTTLPGRVPIKTDFKLILPPPSITCARRRHHGHVFDDGPQPPEPFATTAFAFKFVPSA